MQKDDDIIQQVQCWVSTVIVELNFCPFARRELERNSVRYSVDHEKGMQHHLESLIEECRRLDDDKEIETTLLIYPNAYPEFEEFLDLIAIADDLLIEQEYEGVYQLAHFHPDYRFDGVARDDASNYTNRAPFPILHLIREASIEQALKYYPEVGKIPQKNIALAREMGIEQMQQKLIQCKKTDGSQ